MPWHTKLQERLSDQIFKMHNLRNTLSIIPVVNVWIKKDSARTLFRVSTPCFFQCSDSEVLVAGKMPLSGCQYCGSID